MVLICTLRKWYPRQAGVWHRCQFRMHIYKSIGVSLLARARDEPQNASRGPVEWVLVLVPAPGTRAARSERRWPRPRGLRFCSKWEFQVGSCLYVTAAVKGGSLRASRTLSQRPKLVQGSIGTCRELSPPSSPFPSLPSFFAFWGFPEWNTQGHPSLSLVCPWAFVRSWEHLPFSFLFSPSLSVSLSLFLSSLHLPSSLGVPGCFRHSWEPFLFGVSLDACVVAGRTFASFFLFFSFLPPPPPSPLARGMFTSKLGFCNRFLNEVWTVIGLSPFIGPHRRLPFLSFMSFRLHASSSSSFLSLARTFVRALVCTHTRTRILLTTRLRWPGLLQ